MKENIVLEKSKNFALRVIKLTKYLESKNEYVISKQVLRSGTSIGASVSESDYAISKNDFINKLYISLKEAAETKYWLELLNKSEYINDKEYISLSNECGELIRILSSSIKTAKDNEKIKA